MPRPVLALILLAACGTGGRDAPTAPPPAAGVEPAAADRGGVPAEPQRGGDPAAGFARLLGEGYVGCGAPRWLYDRFSGGTPEAWKVPGRTGPGADLPYFLNSYTGAGGTELVTANCLGCHASYLRGQLVLGLGESASDFTFDVSRMVTMGGLLITEPTERAEWDKLAGRVGAIAPHIRTTTVGANPADVIAAVLFAHRDPKTLAWSDEPLLELPTHEPVPVDVPAWWLMKKKTAMFWTGAGRGDHSRIMMTASVMCVDDVATARSIDAYFPDIRAYIRSLQPPAFPEPVDAALAARGRESFEMVCAGCHGTYGPDGRYPNKVVPIEKVGTDPLLHRGSGQFAAAYRDWFNDSFYGEISRLVTDVGYVAPPLDGVWATAPYFHNGSVPTLAAVLDPALRPDRFVRMRGTDAYDLDAVGWRTRPAEDGADGKWVFDSARPGYSNAGHRFGLELDEGERRAVLEYLKTL